MNPMRMTAMATAVAVLAAGCAGGDDPLADARVIDDTTTTSAPPGPTTEPVEATEPPVETTAPPVETTEPPATTAAPETTEPSETTSPPAETNTTTTTAAPAATPVTSGLPRVTGPLTPADPVLVPLAFGDEIIDEVRPGTVPGAGEISVAGEEDVYRMSATKGQQFLFESLGECSYEGGRSLAVRADGAGVSRRVSLLEPCESFDWFEAEATGEVTITIRDAAAQTTGIYSFRIREVTAAPPTELVSGDLVYATGDSGLGVIESFGQRDIFTYQATKDRPFVFKQLGDCWVDGRTDFFSAALDGDGSGTIIFPDGDCSTAKRFDPDTSGEWIFTVGSAANNVFGRYAFQIYELVEDTAAAGATLDDLEADTDDPDEVVVTLDESVLFDFGEATLSPLADQRLIAVAELLNFYGTDNVRVIGHTDAIGTDEDNQALSEARAGAVADRLAALGVDPSRLVVEGRGELEPIAPNENDDGSDNPDGRAANRRVEITFSTG